MASSAKHRNGPRSRPRPCRSPYRFPFLHSFHSGEAPYNHFSSLPNACSAIASIHHPTLALSLIRQLNSASASHQNAPLQGEKASAPGLDNLPRIHMYATDQRRKQSIEPSCRLHRRTCIHTYTRVTLKKSLTSSPQPRPYRRCLVHTCMCTAVRSSEAGGSFMQISRDNESGGSRKKEKKKQKSKTTNTDNA